MKNNIAIVCLDRAMSRSTAQMLSEQLGMRIFDMRELFEFDHKPSTVKDILIKYGATYFREKNAKILRYAAKFNNVVINVDTDVFYKKNTVNPVKENCLIIYLHISATRVLNIIDKEEYCCYKEKSLYALSKEKLNTRIETIRSQADIEVNVSSSSCFKASADILRAINKFYNVN